MTMDLCICSLFCVTVMIVHDYVSTNRSLSPSQTKPNVPPTHTLAPPR